MKSSLQTTQKNWQHEATGHVSLRTLKRAFTLIELLAVLGVVAAVVAIATPAVLDVMNATRLTQAGDEMNGLISQAQQIAASESRPVEVRFYQTRSGDISDDQGGEVEYNALMIVRYYQQGEADPTAPGAPALTAPLAVADFGGIHRLPSGIIMAPSVELSSIMTLPEITAGGGGSGATRLMAKSGNRYEEMRINNANQYRAFLCLPEATDLNAASSWFVTLINSRDRETTSTDIDNFYTIQIEPVTGRLMTYRP
jgi:uncharacterized protein (TIGR02596 family)